MSLYRKKPVVIEAEQWTGTRRGLSQPFADAVYSANSDGVGFIATLEGTHECRPGDLIIRGVKGEFYPCKPDIFAMTYEEVTP